jgi:hypothetical protein
LLLLSRLGGNLPRFKTVLGTVERKAQPRDVFVGMKTNTMKFLGLAVLLAIFTGGCASDDAAGAPPTVIIERDRSSSPPPVIIEKESTDKDVKVDVDVDKD